MKLRAFTMAEMLVAMVIIGVISALTIPTLQQHYQKKTYVAKLQKAMHVLNNGFKLMRVEEGVRFLSRTNMIDCADDIFISGLVRDELNCISSHMKKYFNIINYSKSNDTEEYYDHSQMRTLAGGDTDSTSIEHGVFIKYYSFYTGDNMLYAPFVNAEKVYVDINGKEAPNRFGRDIFVLSINDLGEVEPICLNGEWNQNGTECKCDNALSGAGLGCAARIKEEGWKMNY